VKGVPNIQIGIFHPSQPLPGYKSDVKRLKGMSNGDLEWGNFKATYNGMAFVLTHGIVNIPSLKSVRTGTRNIQGLKSVCCEFIKGRYYLAYFLLLRTNVRLEVTMQSHSKF
jgi:hypothetical protein